jgi:hypothetical protein
MKQLIEFFPKSKDVEQLVPYPVPAKLVIPEWYKESKSFFNGNTMSFDQNNYLVESTIKKCIPLLDVLTSGYVQTSWSDIYIEEKEESLAYYIASGPDLMRERPRIAFQKMPIPDGYHNYFFTWERPWGIKTPPGYSTLITTPMYREDLPFRCVSGIIDTDSHHLYGGVTFFIKKGFTGTIPVGTPLFQMLPFKRDNWKSIGRTFEETNKISKGKPMVRSYFVGGYKKLHWKKKTYE